MNILLDLYISFVKIGFMTFGGGYAMLPILEREVVEKKKWATSEEILDYYAIGQSTPGIIAINTATFCGYKMAKNIGGLVASLGFITPSIIIITLISKFLENFSHIEAIQHAFVGIRIAVCALVLYSVIKMVRKNANSLGKFAVFLLTFLAIAVLNISPVLIVIGVGLLGIVLGRFRNA
ncbi:chromate transporter [Anaerococcus murdochii]|uniref:chromate transporter n=1 Tax=Anaerococcus murdochii TaxID=411577 RepID=UPI0032B3E0B8